MNILPEGVVVLDRYGNLLYNNKSIERILEVKQEEIYNVLMNLKNIDVRNIDNELSNSHSKNSDIDDLDFSKNGDSFIDMEMKKKPRKSTFFKLN